MKIKPTPARKPSMLQPKWIGLALLVVGAGQFLNAAVLGLGVEAHKFSHILIGGITAVLGLLMLIYGMAMQRDRAKIRQLAAGRSGLAKGFTLIEVVITLAIIAVLFTMIGGVLLSVLKTQDVVGQTIDEEKIGHGVLSLLQRDFAGCVGYGLGPVVFRVEDKSNGGGEADEIHFLTASSGEVFAADDSETNDDDDVANTRPPRYRKVSFVLRSSPSADTFERYVLCRRAEPLTGDDRDPTSMSAPYVEVVDGLLGFKIELKAETNSDWQDGWPDPSRLPTAIRLTVDVAPSVQRITSANELGLSTPQPTRFQTIISVFSVSVLQEDAPATQENQ